MNKYRVFISSTVSGLDNARAAAATVISSLEIFEPRRAEDLPATDMPSRLVCMEEVRAADIVILLTGDRYGFVPPSNNPNNLSVTHLEYREAQRLYRPIFAFIGERQNIEESQSKFLVEIEDFDSGVFRRRWKTTAELEDHIRRSLLWWVARRARRNEPLRVTFSSVLSELNTAHLKTLPIHIHAVPGSEIAAQWIRDSLQVLANETTPTTLLPVLQEASTQDSVAIVVSTEPLQQSHNYRVTIHANVPGEERVTLPLNMQSVSSPVTQLVEVLRGIRYLLIDDPGASADVLLRSAKQGTLDTSTRAALIGLSVRLSDQYKLEMVLDGAQELLKLPQVDQKLISTVAMALFRTILRFKNKNLLFAKRQTELLYVGVLTKSLKQGSGGPEEIYTLSRQALGAGLKIGPQLYFDLLKIHPYYEERWYWHRDLGLHYYSQGDLKRAAIFYDKARELKPDYALLHRFAGDAHYYQGQWVSAMNSFQTAVSEEPTEKYALDMKIAFARNKIIEGIVESRYFRWRRRLSEAVSRVGVLLEDNNLRFLAPLFFRLGCATCELNFTGAKWRAFYANRRGDYKLAIRMLRLCLASTCENPSVRLNLTLNLIFENKGKLTEEAKQHLAAAIFNGGPGIRNQFSVSLINTPESSTLLSEFDQLVSVVKAEWEAAQLRRIEVTKPTKFGQALHLEVW